MELTASFLIAIGLAMDAFAVSLGVAAAGKARDARARFRLAFHFGFFQMAMTVLGWLLGSTIANFINGFDHWIALALLGYVGFNMVRSGFDPDKEICQSNPSKGKTLMLLCVATSLDAMAVGLSMAMLQSICLLPFSRDRCSYLRFMHLRPPCRQPAGRDLWKEDGSAWWSES